MPRHSPGSWLVLELLTSTEPFPCAHRHRTVVRESGAANIGQL